jgi:dimethylaniline monooxygenase (N-oxide forming)
MQASITEEKAWSAAQFPDTPRYGLELDPRRYRKILASAYAKNKVERNQTTPIVAVAPKATLAPRGG